MVVTKATYARVALENGDAVWELDEGRLREKPPGIASLNDAMVELGFRLAAGLDRVRINAGRGCLVGTSRWTPTLYGPDVFVPDALTVSRRGRRVLESCEEPLPLVAKVRSSLVPATRATTSTSTQSSPSTAPAATTRSGASTSSIGRSTPGSANRTAPMPRRPMARPPPSAPRRSPASRSPSPSSSRTDPDAARSLSFS